VGKRQFLSVDFPGSNYSSGEIVGALYPLRREATRFIFREGGFTSFDVPGAGLTDTEWINARGDMVGSYVAEGANQGHAYVWSDGTLTTIDSPPGESTALGLA
jgi:hypothetical protein